MVITIDGPSGSGKSTVADLLAKRLNINHLNTGAIYRAVTCALVDMNIHHKDIGAISTAVQDMDIMVTFADGKQMVTINGLDFGERLRDNVISVKAPLYSTSLAVREKISQFTRDFAAGNSIVLDGRDSGSYVLPDAEHKFYLDASLLERSRRRYTEMLNEGKNVPMHTLMSEIETRDRFDKAKKIAPLVIPKNAIIIDNTKMNLEETCDEMMKYIKY